ncbi:hypothetical protein AVEN_104323-1, partial [Araneus ventricosus]
MIRRRERHLSFATKQPKSQQSEWKMADGAQDGMLKLSSDSHT